MPAPNATDTNFEKTFSDLAFTRLQDKAPSLLNFLVGFQLIDKNEDDTHAVGVFGFKVGPEWVYAPVFFINGELKGHELLYLKDQDLFVPMVEEWINFILHRRPQNMGQAEPTPRANLGIRQPDFNVFARVPYIGSKYASVAPMSYRQICDSMAEWAKPFMDVFLTGPRDQKYASLVERFDLRNAVRNMGKKAAYSLFNTMKKDATFAEALMKFYDLKELVNASREGIKEAAEKAPKKDGMPKTVVITRGDDPSGVMKDMSDEDKRKLLQNGYVVKDERSDDQKTRIYKTQIAAQYSSPTANGLYGVVTTKGGQRDLLVITSPINIGRPGAVRQGCSLVVDPKTKQFGWFGSMDLMVSKRLDDNYQWQDEFSSDDLAPLSELTVGQVATIVTPRCDATVPFVVEKSVTNQEGQTELKVRDVYIPERSGSMQMKRRYMSDGNFDYDCFENKIDTVVITKKPGIKMNIIGSTIFVPESCRAVIAGKAKEDKPEPYVSYKSPKTFDKSLGATDDIGTLPEVITNLYKTASFPGGAMQRMSVRTDGISYSVSVQGHESHPMSKIAMIKELVMSLGLGCEVAEELVKEARPKKMRNYFVKAASPFQATFNEPVKSHLFNMRAPVQYPQLELQNLGNSSEYTNNRQFYQEDPFVDDTAKTRAIESANMGQKDVLDTSVINGLVKNMDADGAIEDYISDVMLGMDRLGRLLFLYYWHNDKFEERYGKQDMIQLEGNLRNVFKNTGDVVLFMKQKSVQATSSFRDTEPRLKDVLV